MWANQALCKWHACARRYHAMCALLGALCHQTAELVGCCGIVSRLVLASMFGSVLGDAQQLDERLRCKRGAARRYIAARVLVIIAAGCVDAGFS